jgi:hypothetical protein
MLGLTPRPGLRAIGGPLGAGAGVRRCDGDRLPARTPHDRDTADGVQVVIEDPADGGVAVGLSVNVTGLAREQSPPASWRWSQVWPMFSLQRRRAAQVSDGDEQSLFVDTVAEYPWARDAAGLAPSTLSNLTRPVLEICDYYGVVA